MLGQFFLPHLVIKYEHGMMSIPRGCLDRNDGQLKSATVFEFSIPLPCSDMLTPAVGGTTLIIGQGI